MFDKLGFVFGGRRRLLCGSAFLAATLLAGGAAQAQTTVSSTLNVTITIGAACNIGNITPVDFGTRGVLDTQVDAQGSIDVSCTGGTTFNIGLDGGSGTVIATRRMVNQTGLQTVSYQLFREAARTSVWGNTIGSDTVPGTGNGASQTFPVYGRVPAQPGFGTGTFSDSVQVTVTY